MPHTLDRAVWNALNGRLSHLTTADSTALARRIDPEVGVFLSAADGSDDSRAAIDRLGAVDATRLQPVYATGSTPVL